MGREQEKGEAQESGAQSTEAIEIDGRKFTVDDVKGLQKSATQAQQVAKVLAEAAGKYDMGPEDYVNQAEGAFALASKLVQEGIINERGEVVGKKASPQEDKEKATTEAERTNGRTTDCNEHGVD